MEKTQIYELLAEQSQLTVEEAKNFFHKFFDVVNQGLIDEKQVKVKGLGTFKVIDVKDRESVDVNTGDRIMIEGHSKISFTPDANMRDRVNKPFSQFETITLSNDIDMNSIERVSEDETKKILEVIDSDPFAYIPDEAPAAAAPATTGPVATDEEKIVETVQQEIGTPTEEEKVSPTEESMASIQEENAVSAEEEVVAPAEKESVVPTEEESVVPAEEEKTTYEIENTVVAEELIKEGASSAEEPAETQTPDTLMGSRKNSDDSSNTVRSQSKNEKQDNQDDDDEKSCPVRWILLCIVLAILSFCGGFFAGKHYATNSEIPFADTIVADTIPSDAMTGNNVSKPTQASSVAKYDTVTSQSMQKVVEKQETNAVIEQKTALEAKPEVKTEAKPTAKSEVKPTAKPEVKPAAKPEAKPAAKPEAKPAAKTEVKPTTKTEVKPAAKPEAKQKSEAKATTIDYDAKDARVRTGAYRITGTQTTYKVKAGETLQRISDRFLGPGMECYIEVYNSKNSVAEGDVIKIPSLELRKKKKQQQ